MSHKSVKKLTILAAALGLLVGTGAGPQVPAAKLREAGQVCGDSRECFYNRIEPLCQAQDPGESDDCVAAALKVFEHQRDTRGLGRPLYDSSDAANAAQVSVRQKLKRWGCECERAAIDKPCACGDECARKITEFSVSAVRAATAAYDHMPLWSGFGIPMAERCQGQEPLRAACVVTELQSLKTQLSTPGSAALKRVDQLCDSYGAAAPSDRGCRKELTAKLAAQAKAALSSMAWVDNVIQSNQMVQSCGKDTARLEALVREATRGDGLSVSTTISWKGSAEWAGAAKAEEGSAGTEDGGGATSLRGNSASSGGDQDNGDGSGSGADGDGSGNTGTSGTGRTVSEPNKNRERCAVTDELSKKFGVRRCRPEENLCSSQPGTGLKLCSLPQDPKKAVCTRDAAKVTKQLPLCKVRATREGCAPSLKSCVKSLDKPSPISTGTVGDFDRPGDPKGGSTGRAGVCTREPELVSPGRPLCGDAPSCKWLRLYGGVKCKKGDADPDDALPCAEIPSRFCGDWAAYNPKHYRMEKHFVPDEDGGYVEDIVTRTQTPEDGSYPVGKEELALMDGIARLERKRFQGDVLPFVVEIYAQEALQKALIRGQDLGAVASRLQGAVACFNDRPAVMSGISPEDFRAIGPRLKEKIRAAASAYVGIKGNASLDAKRERYGNSAVLAGQCSGAIQKRLKTLAYDLALDVRLVTENVWNDVAADMDKLGGRASEYGVVAETGTRFAMATLKAVAGVTGVVGMLSLPSMIGAEEAAKRPCSIFAQAASPERALACRSVTEEFLALSQELKETSRQYPESLVTGASFKEKGLDPRIKNYNASFASADVLDPADGGASRWSCMERFRTKSADLESGLDIPSAEAKAVADKALKDDRSLDRSLTAIQDLCDPAHWDRTVEDVLGDPALKRELFNCDRRLAAGLSIQLGKKPARSVSNDECMNLGNAAWIACREVKRIKDTNTLKGQGGNALQAAFWNLGVMAPMMSARGAVGFVAWGPASARATLTGAGIGAGIGGSLGTVFSPDVEELRRRVRFEEVICRSGYVIPGAKPGDCAGAARKALADAGHGSIAQGTIDGMVDGAIGGWLGAGALKGEAPRSALPGAGPRSRLQLDLNLIYGLANAAEEGGDVAMGAVNVEASVLERMRRDLRELRPHSPRLKALSDQEFDLYLIDPERVVDMAEAELYTPPPSAAAGTQPSHRPPPLEAHGGTGKGANDSLPSIEVGEANLDPDFGKVDVPGAVPDAPPTVVLGQGVEAVNIPDEIYVAGDGLHQSVKPPTYKYTAPAQPVTISPDSIPAVKNFPDKPAPERLADHFGGDGMVASYKTTQAGIGALSEAYFVHPPLPESVKQLSPDNPVRKDWAEENAIEVIKLRRRKPFPKPDGTSAYGMDIAGNYLERDLAQYQLAVELAKGAELDGKPLVRVAKILSSKEEHAKGIIRQEAVKGVSADDLQMAVTCLQILSACNVHAAMDESKAKAILAKAGFGDDLQEAQRQIHAIEQFYKDTHHPAQKFQNDHKLATVMNAGPSEVPHEAGFDFGAGRNVIWDAKAKQWVMIDW